MNFNRIMLSMCISLLTLQIQAADYEAAFTSRRQLLIEHIADYYPLWNNGERPIGYDGGVSDFGKYNYPKVLAVLVKYGDRSPQYAVMKKRMDIYKTKPTFHFNLVELPRILFMFPDAEGVKENKYEFLKRVFERTDCYNAWTCEGTENHIAMSRTSGYLYAQIAADNYSDSFPDALQRLQEMKKWILYTARTIYHTGTAEWNSSTYNCYNVMGWLNLFDFAADTVVKMAAKAVLDYYAAETALLYSQGIMSGGDMRGKGAVSSYHGSASYLGWMWYGSNPFMMTPQNFSGEDERTSEHIHAIHAALSAYRPPAAAVAIAERKMPLPAMYYNSKPSYLYDIPSYIRQTFYVEKSFTLGAAYLPYGGWTGGDIQIVGWKLVGLVDSGSPSAQAVSGRGVNRPDKSASGQQRMPFDQLAHHKNVLFQLTRVPEDAEKQRLVMDSIINDWKKKWSRDFFLRFPADTARHNPVGAQQVETNNNRSYLFFNGRGMYNPVFAGNILFVEMEKIYLVVRSLRGNRPDSIKRVKKADVMFTSVEAAPGKVCGFVIEVHEKQKFKSFDAFRKKIAAGTMLDFTLLDSLNKVSYQSLQGDKFMVQYSDSGSFTEPIFDWGFGPQQPAVIHSSPPYLQPVWPSGKGHGKIASWSVNGKPIDLSSPWPVYSGPMIHLNNGVLYLTDVNQSCYCVDFTGEAPVFSRVCPVTEKK